MSETPKRSIEQQHFDEAVDAVAREIAPQWFEPPPEDLRELFMPVQAELLAKAQGWARLGILRGMTLAQDLPGKQQALIEGGCRGGFGTGELDQFIPGWRDELSTIGALTARAEAAEAKVAELEADKARMDWLEQQHVDVKHPLRWGYKDGFTASPSEDELTSDLRYRIDAALGAKP